MRPFLFDTRRICEELARMQRDEVQRITDQAQEAIMPKRYQRCRLTFLDDRVIEHTDCAVFYSPSAVEVQTADGAKVYPLANLRSYELT